MRWAMVKMRNREEPLQIEEETTIKEVLLCCPRALRVILDRKVPATCGHSTIREAARAAGIAPSLLLADLRLAVGGGGVRENGN